MELRDAIAELSHAQSALRRKHGWAAETEPVASRHDGFTADSVRPIFVLQNMGYRWRVEQIDRGLASQSGYLPQPDEPLCTWLHPPDTTAYTVTNSDIEAARQAGKRKKR